MDRDSKILIGAVIVIIIAIFSFNSGITGSVVKDVFSASIKIDPEVVNPGDIIFISVIPGSGGVNNKVNIYNAEDELRKSSIELCKGSYKCLNENTVSYWVSDSWKPGVYYVKVYDYDRKGFIIEDFTIR